MKLTDDMLEVAAKLALFTTALVLAVVAGWGVGQLVGPTSAPPAPATAHDH